MALPAPIVLSPILLAFAIGLPAAAQDGGATMPNAVTDVSELPDAARALAGMAEDKLLVADLLGMELTGRDGAVIGTVTDFVVIPGGRLIAAVLSGGEGDDGDGSGRIVVPFAAIKLNQGADRVMGLTLTAEEVRGPEDLRSLSSTLLD